MKKIDKGVVFSGVENIDRQSNTFPQICILASGRWICGFRSAPTKLGCAGQNAVILWSDDQGKLWSEPVAPFEPKPVEGKLYLSSGNGTTVNLNLSF